MGASRTSNKDIADKLDTLIDIMTQQAIGAPVTPEPTTTESPKETGAIEVDKEYLAHMNTKAADHATAKGSEVVLYARKNKQGETKLAYALRDRYDDQIIGQPSHIGPVGCFQA